MFELYSYDMNKVSNPLFDKLPESQQPSVRWEMRINFCYWAVGLVET